MVATKDNKKSKMSQRSIAAYLLKKFIDEANVPPRPWLVLGEPSVQELEDAFSAFPEFDDMISEGVLISTRVHEADNDPTNIAGFINGIQIEGIGATPEEAVVNTMSGVEFDTLENMQRQTDAVFKPYWDFLGVGVRRRDKEKGIFLKVDDNGRVIIHDEFRNIEMQEVRQWAHAWQEKMMEMQRAISVGYVAEIIKRQRTVENALTQYKTALRRQSRLANATAAAELARAAAKSIKEAEEARQHASKYSKYLNGASIVQSIIGLASVANTVVESQAQQKAMQSISNQLQNTDAKIGYLESSIRNLANQMTRNHQSLKKQIDAVAPANNFVITNISVHIDFNANAEPLPWRE